MITKAIDAIDPMFAAMLRHNVRTVHQDLLALLDSDTLRQFVAEDQRRTLVAAAQELHLLRGQLAIATHSGHE